MKQELPRGEKLYFVSMALGDPHIVDSPRKNDVETNYPQGRRRRESHIQLHTPLELLFRFALLLFKGKHLQIFKSHKRPGVRGITSEVINPLFQQVSELENDDLLPMSYLSEPFYGYNVVRASHPPAKLVELLVQAIWQNQSKTMKIYMPFVLENSTLGTDPR